MKMMIIKMRRWKERIYVSISNQIQINKNFISKNLICFVQSVFLTLTKLIGKHLVCHLFDIMSTEIKGIVDPVKQSKTKRDVGVTSTTAVNQKALYSSGILYGNGPIPMSDTVAFLAGLIEVLFVIPGTIVVVGLTVLWDALDRGFMGKPGDGVVMSIARFVNRTTAPLWKSLVKHPEDAYLINLIICLGIVVPILFGASLYYTLHYGFSLPLCLAYHVIRLGPYFMNFAYCYTLCHKEGHSRTGLFAPILHPVFKNVFNWWIGLFYGVMPASFAFGHSINHHK